MTATGLTAHRVLGSKTFVQTLYSLGVSHSYDEILRYERLVALKFKIEIKIGPNNKPFLQFGVDNTDFNTNTPTGKCSFQFLGVIGILASKDDLEKKLPIKREAISPTAEALEVEAHVEFHHYPDEKKKCGLAKVKVQKRNQNMALKATDSTKLSYFWMYLQFISKFKFPGWNGFMEKLTSQNKDYNISEILFYPFINAPPSDYSTLYSAAIFCKEQAKKAGMKTIINTADQPLYIKLPDIVHSGVFGEDHVVARLGGFHCYMSYLGCIGYIMAGSGLKELLSEVFAENTVDHMFTGKAYAKAVRAHMLI